MRAARADAEGVHVFTFDKFVIEMVRMRQRERGESPFKLALRLHQRRFIREATAGTRFAGTW